MHNVQKATISRRMVATKVTGERACGSSSRWEKDREMEREREMRVSR